LGYDRQWLEHQYHTLEKTCNQIAKEIGRDPKRVWEWIKDYGIQTRPRGSNYKENLIMDGSPFRGKKHKKETRDKLREMAIKDGRLPWGKGNPPPWKGRTGKDHPSWKGGATPERQAFYATDEWREAVKAVWQRDNAICQRCGKSHNGSRSEGAFHIHHIVSFQVEELRTDPDNLVLLCKDCHRFVHSKKNVNGDFIKEPDQ
jgi:hypothetical protein